jgi:hypothetical protein
MPSKEERIASYKSRIARKHDVKQLLRTNVGVVGLESREQPSKQFLETHASASAGASKRF